MFYSIIQPSALLSDIVRYFWIYEGEGTVDQPFIHRSMADGSVEIVFHYKGQFANLQKNSQESLASIFGQSLHFNRYAIEEKFAIFGVYLYPFAISKLVNIPAGELSNQEVDLQSLFGTKGMELEMEILGAQTNLERIRIMSTFLEKLMRQNYSPLNQIQLLVKQMVDTPSKYAFFVQAENLCLSVRQFQRRFKDAAGFPLKTYQRLIRYSSTLAYYGQRDKSLTDIATECGYFDQAHFIHDFKAFTGYNPKMYFLGQAEGTDYRDA